MIRFSFIFTLFTLSAVAQTKTVNKTISNNALTESLVLPTGKSITINAGASIINNGTATGFGSGGAWGTITGTLSAQTDLQSALDLKAPIASPTFTGSVIVPSGLVINAGGGVGSFDFLGSSAFNKITVRAASLSGINTITIPNITGTLITTGDTGTVTDSMLGTGLDASKMTLGTLGVANGGTGTTALGQNMVLLGNGTDALQAVAPSTSGNVLTSNGTTWVSAAPSAGGATLAANTFTGLQDFSGTSHAGLRLNNLTTVQRDALASPAAGMAIWNTTDGRLQLHNGSSWTSGMVRLAGDTMTGALSVTLSALGTTPTAALSLTNSTAATSGNQQVSPSIILEGQGWKTTATAASQSVMFRQNVLPVQGTTNPTGNWRLQADINGAGTWGTVLQVTSAGLISTTGTNTISGGTDPGFSQGNSGRPINLQTTSGFTNVVDSTPQLGFATTASNTNPPLRLVMAASGILTLRGTSGTTGAPLELQEQTAPSAPATNNVRIYAEDNGSGKTRIMALFPTGAAVQIAIEP